MASPSDRTAEGRFVKGVSGNPAGRPRGARNKVTIAVETLLEGQPTGLAQMALNKALKGDRAALKLCLDRICPPPKNRPIPFDMPPITSAADALRASTELLEAVSMGDVTPDEGVQVMKLIKAHAAIVDSGKLEARVRALEGRWWVESKK